MFSFFKRKSEFRDQAFEELARMLTEELGDPPYRRELLDPQKLDFSLASLEHVDDYLDVVHQDQPGEEDLLRVVLRCGAYVGEVIRRLSPRGYHWLDYEGAARRA